jgi:regulator of protease activity HflC (stomatin/prohibitin superfamily)
MLKTCVIILLAYFFEANGYLLFVDSLLFQTVSREIRKILTERARNFNIALDDVSITSLSFGKEFTHAIEAKQVAAQEAERAKFIVEKAEQDKRSAIIRAQVRNSVHILVLRKLCRE